MPYFDPATAESEQDHYLNVASDIVQRLAPVPSPEPVDYADKAARAERLLLTYLTSTKGATLTSKSLSGLGSKSFADQQGVRNIVRSAMGTYYAPGGPAVPIRRPGYRRVPYFINDPLDLKGPFFYP